MRLTILAILALFACMGASRADVSGARLTYRGMDLQIVTPSDEPSQELFDLLFGNGGVVSQMGAAIVRQPATAIKPRDLTVEVTLDQGSLRAQFLSGSIADLDTRYREDFRAANAMALVLEVCKILEFSGCNSPPPPMRGARPASARPLPSDLVVTIGALPAAPAAETVAVPTTPPQPGARLKKATRGERSFGDAVREKAQRAFVRKQSDVRAPPMPGAQPALPRRAYFAVHCTAFAAPDDSMRRWVANRISQGIRYQSHGVILPSGEYLPMYSFDDQRVHATKTETCRETRSSAYGAVINIEVHYFCAANRPDKASEKQYDTLANLFKDVNQRFGPLTIVSHREIDRGLRDGHNDPIGFEFAKFYDVLRTKGVNVDSILKISDARHSLRTGPDLSHGWPPAVSGPLVNESARPDKCRRDH